VTRPTKINLTNNAKWCFFSAQFEIEDNENHVCTNAEARAIQWIYVHLDARLPSRWHRGNEILIS
jgi:hypothetical protein